MGSDNCDRLQQADYYRFGHRGIPRENEPDFLSEAAAVFLTAKPQKKTSSKKPKMPTSIKSAGKKATKANKKLAA